MARTLTTPMQVARMLMASDHAWLFFVEIAAKSGGYFRLVNNRTHLTADGKVWQGASIEIELPEEQGDGALADLSLTVGNASRLPGLFVEQGEIIGRTLTVWLAHSSSLGAFDPSLCWSHRITKADVAESAVKITAAHPAGFLRIPRGVYERTTFPQLPATGGVRG